MNAPLPQVFQNGQGSATADYFNGLVQGVASVAQLRGFVGVPGMTIFLQGTTTPADGGQGTFYWSPASTAADNGTTVIKPTGVTVGGRWLADPPVIPPIPAAYPFTIVANSGGGDDTAALQAALNTGGAIYLLADVYNYTTLTITVPCRLIGAVQSSGSPASVLNCTLASSADKIVIGNNVAYLDGIELEHLMFKAPTSTGGAIVSFIKCSASAIRNFQMISLGGTTIGIKANQVNTLRIHSGTVIQPHQAGLYAYGGDTTRSDIIEIIGFTVTGDAVSGATILPNGVDLDGYVNTIVGEHWYFVQCGRGIYRHNSVASTARAEFTFVADLEVDFPYYECVRIEWGDSHYFTRTYMHGSVTTYNLYVGTSSPNTIDNIRYIGGECTGAFKAGMYLDGRYTQIMGVEVSTNGLSGSNTYDGIEIGPDALSTTIIGNHIGIRSGAAGATQRYGVKVNAGATNYTIMGNDLIGNVTGPLLANSAADNSSGIITPNIGMLTADSFTVQAPTTGFSITMGTAGGAFNAHRLILEPLGTLANGTIHLDPAPFDGQELRVFSSQIVTTLTVSGAGGQTLIGAPTTIAANGSFVMQYGTATNTWYRAG